MEILGMISALPLVCVGVQTYHWCTLHGAPEVAVHWLLANTS